MKKYRQTFNSAMSRAGFTLVEMMVSVALVLLMMSMFAAIFQLAAGSTSTQRGIAQNDQRARSITTTLRSDLDSRTFRNVIPFIRGEDQNNTPIDFTARAGFIQIVTNDPANGLDDTLLLTVRDETTGYYGSGPQLMDPSVTTAFTGNNNFVDNPNQPEMDDSVITTNGTTTSTAAQIAYFVRDGSLFRRVLPIREPVGRAGSDLKPQPQYADGTFPLDLDGDATTPQYFLDLDGDGLTDPTTEASENFWRDFDLSAVRVGGLAQVIGADSLDNGPGGTLYSLGLPQYRLGHSSVSVAPWTGGFPRLFNSIATSPQFTGFFTQEETSFAGNDTYASSGNTLLGGFNYPQGDARYRATDTAVTPAASTLAPVPTGTATGDPTDIRVELGLTPNKVYSDFQGGTRRAEDLLLTNVHEFRVELWDTRLGQWVYPGHTRFGPGANGTLGDADDVAGDYHAARRFNHGFGPFGPAGGSRLGGAAYGSSITSASASWNFTNHVFDTWHPNGFAGDTVTSIPAANANPNMPPFRAMEFYPPFRPDGTAEPQTTDDLSGATGFAKSYWSPSSIDWDDPSMSSYKTYITEDTNGNDILDSGEDANGNGVLDVPVVFAQNRRFER